MVALAESKAKKHSFFKIATKILVFFNDLVSKKAQGGRQANIIGFRCQEFNDLGIKGFRNRGIHVSVNLIDRIHLIPKFLNSQFLN